MVAVVSIPTVHLRRFENDQPRLVFEEVLALRNIKRTRVDDCQAVYAMRPFTELEETSLFGSNSKVRSRRIVLQKDWFRGARAGEAILKAAETLLIVAQSAWGGRLDDRGPRCTQGKRRQSPAPGDTDYESGGRRFESFRARQLAN